jgi:hypothetical protein
MYLDSGSARDEALLSELEADFLFKRLNRNDRHTGVHGSHRLAHLRKRHDSPPVSRLPAPPKDFRIRLEWSRTPSMPEHARAGMGAMIADDGR